MNDDCAVLRDCLGSPAGLSGLIEYARDSIVSKTILDRPAGTITIFAFDRGQRLSEHTSPYDAVVQLVDGRAVVSIGSNKVEVTAGQLIVMPAGIPHAIAAAEPFKMLLIMIRDGSDA